MTDKDREETASNIIKACCDGEGAPIFNEVELGRAIMFWVYDMTVDRAAICQAYDEVLKRIRRSQ